MNNPDMWSLRWMACLIVLLAAPALSQVSDQRLTELYGRPQKGLFAVGPRAYMAVTYVAERRICLLTISGALTTYRLRDVFDEVIPSDWRGPTKQDLEQCVHGGCVRTIEYRAATFSFATAEPGSAAEPTAYIALRSSECDRIAHGAKGFAFRPSKTR